MEKPKFKTNYNANLFPKTPEKGSGERRVETAGYIDVKTRIENMMMAGQRLIEARKEMYDFDGEVDEDFYDPTREKSFDMAEAFQIANNLADKARQKAREKQQEASGEAEKGGGGVTPPPPL